MKKLGLEEQDVTVSGLLVLYNNMLQSLFKSQIKTIGVVMLGIAIMFLVLFRSITLSIIGILPNLLGAVVVLGGLGWANIPMDMMTITIAAITIGIAVDNGIHYIYRFREEYTHSQSYVETLHICHSNIGKAVFYTTMTIIFGFSILVFSNFIPTIYFWCVDCGGDVHRTFGGAHGAAEADLTVETFRPRGWLTRTSSRSSPAAPWAPSGWRSGRERRLGKGPRLARQTAHFVCQQCGAAHPKWGGRCDSCGAWNTLAEEALADATPKGLGKKRGRKIGFAPLQGLSEATERLITGIGEFDRVTGGGPGAGFGPVGRRRPRHRQVPPCSCRWRRPWVMRARPTSRARNPSTSCGCAPPDWAWARPPSGWPPPPRCATSRLPWTGRTVPVSLSSIPSRPCTWTLWDSSPGTVAQVRASAQELIRLAKGRGFTLILVGHVTKEGMIAGPRVLEHMVDTVLYFEGEHSHQFRILRARKNRFGPTDEIGVFDMTGSGLREVANPSALFLGERQGEVSGASVLAGMEGTRPLLVEIQSLVAPSALATPRRAVVGWDSGRLAMILAVLEARCGLAFTGCDVYLNVAGGLKIGEPAADLAAAAALVSAKGDVPVPPDTVFFGEVGLSGEVRKVTHTDMRLKEAGKLGFKRAILPAGRGGGARDRGLEIRHVTHLADLLAIIPPSAKGTGAEGGRRHG